VTHGTIYSYKSSSFTNLITVEDIFNLLIDIIRGFLRFQKEVPIKSVQPVTCKSKCLDWELDHVSQDLDRRANLIKLMLKDLVTAQVLGVMVNKSLEEEVLIKFIYISHKHY